jgi:hypothetical protein
VGGWVGEREEGGLGGQAGEWGVGVGGQAGEVSVVLITVGNEVLSAKISDANTGVYTRIYLCIYLYIYLYSLLYAVREMR